MPEFDPRNYPYSSHRNVVYARKAMACTSIPQGAQIGLDVMKAGGSAIDAAVAMAAAMPLLEPTSNGLGSDCFASARNGCAPWAFLKCPRPGGFPPWCPGPQRGGRN